MKRTRAANLAALTVLAGMMAATSGVTKSPAKETTVSGQSALTIASAQGITTLDPHKLTFTWEAVLYPMLWSGLVKYTRGGGTELQPDLATSWKSSRDLKTWTFKLRPGLEFSDGKPLTAQHVVGSILRARNPKTGFYRATDLAAVARARAVNRTTVRFTLNRPLATFPWNLLKVRIIDPGRIADLRKNPPTTGPYSVAEFVPDDHVTLEPNASYWGKAAPLREIKIVRAQDDPSAVASLRAGDVQALWNLPWQDIKQLKKNRSMKVVLGQSPATNVVLEMDNQSPPFDNVKARQALAYAVDRKTMVAAAYAGTGLIPWTNQPIPSNNSLFNRRIAKYSYNAQRAKQLFSEAGITSSTALTYWTPAGAYSEWRIVGQILQQDLAKVGIKLTIKTAEINTWASRFSPNGKKYPGLIVPNFYSGSPPQILYSFKTGAAENNYSNTRYDALVEQADGTINRAKRKRIYDEAQKIFSTEVPTVFLVQNSAPIAVRSNVGRVWIDPIGFPRFEDAVLTG
jgi:peptide/nickel transport system substrate-binding protein